MAINFSPCRASYNQTRKENFTEVCFSLTVLYEHIFKRKIRLCTSTNVVFSGCCIGSRFLLRFTFLMRHLLQSTKLARISIVFTFAIFSSADRQANYPEFQRADNKSPHCKSSVLYLGNWAICKTLHQAKDIIFLGS